MSHKIISIIDQARSRALKAVNAELIRMYWDVGEYLSGLCAAKDDAVVEYALSRSMSPTLVSDYTLRLPDKKLLRDKLRELTDLALEAGENKEED